MAEPNLRERGALVEALGSSLGHGGQNLSTAIGALERTINEDAWREFVARDGRDVKPRSFEEFVITPPLSGLGVTVALVKRIIGDNTRLRDKVDELLQNPNGIHRPDSIRNSRPIGTTKDQALRRLRKDAPELHADVLSGKLSPHAAMVKAGFRHPTATIQLDDAHAAARTLRSRGSAEFLAMLRKILDEDTQP